MPYVGVRTLQLPETRVERARALGRRLLDGQAISGLAAAELWGLRVPRRVATDHSDVEVLTRASASRVRIPGVKSRAIRENLFRASTLGGVPVVSPVLSVLTSAAHLPTDDVTVMLDALLADSDVYPNLNFSVRPVLAREQLSTMLETFKRMKGVGVLREASESARPKVESPMESVTRLKCVSYGLPEPIIQPIVRLPNGKEYRPDLGYPWANTYINYDGEFHYTDQRVIDRDALRDRDFQEANIRLIRVVKSDLSGKRWTELVRTIRLSLLRCESR